MPGPIGTWDHNYEINDGTMCRMPSQPPGPMERRSPSMLARAEALREAFDRALFLAPAAVYQKTGYALGELLKGLLPGLLQAVVILGASTALGGAAGGAIGFLFGRRRSCAGRGRRRRAGL